MVGVSCAKLDDFLTACSKTKMSLALEVRHLDWFQPESRDRLNCLLSTLNIAKVLLDTRPIYNCPDDPQKNSQRRKPKVPLQPEILGDVGLVRFISHPQAQYNEAFLHQWTDWLDRWLSLDKTIYFFVHCPQEARSPSTVKLFDSLLQKRCDRCSIPSLPWNQIAPHPTQLSLF